MKLHSRVTLASAQWKLAAFGVAWFMTTGTLGAQSIY
jgi:hypothetical protein